MKMSFRWFGSTDPISLEHIKQIPGVEAIVTSLFDIPAGEIIPLESILEIKKIIEKAGFTIDVLESIPVHEDIKLANPKRDEYINNWCISLENAAKAGISVVCYNFMPAFDWIRTDLKAPLEDGSFSMSYSHKDLAEMDLTEERIAWNNKYTKESLKEMMDACSRLHEDDLWANLLYFLKKVVPVAERVGIKLAIHPDDPPWPVFGIPRIISSEENIDKFLQLYDSPANGVSVCTGSLGANQNNNIPRIIRRFHERIYFMHVRNIKITGKYDYHEVAHKSSCGSLDMVEILKALHENDFKGPLRPDHGRDIWGEEGIPGYGLYDRALGISYISGIWETLEKI